jgi:RNA polymerase sigma-70 factor (ECF subfamily)
VFFERSERAISEIAKKYNRYCHRVSYNILQNHEDADECVNGTFLRVWNAIPPAHPQKLSAFLVKITRNLSLNMYQKNHAAKRGMGQVELAWEELEEFTLKKCGRTFQH